MRVFFTANFQISYNCRNSEKKLKECNVYKIDKKRFIKRNGCCQLRIMTNKILWEICYDLASATNETDVLAVVNKKVKKVIDFSYPAVGILDHGRNSMEWTIPGGAKVVGTGCVNFLKKAAVHQFHISDCPKYVLRLNPGVNIVSVTMIVLKKRSGDIIGCLILFRGSSELVGEGDIPVLKDIAEQVSVAIENIQLKHELRRKEVDRSLLLSFSYDLATVSSVVGLRNILQQYLKQLLRINEYMITVRNLDDSTYDSLLHDRTADTPNDGGTNGIAASAMPITRNMTSKVLSADDPVNFSATPFSGTDRVEDIVGMRLKAAGKDIGILWLRIAKDDNRLLKGVFAQVATVISNILISSEIERQMQEIRCCKKALENQKAESDIDSGANDKPGELIGKGPEMQKIYQAIERVAFCDSRIDPGGDRYRQRNDCRCATW
jgi:formate hydrogenlyase transcriptional activator